MKLEDYIKENLYESSIVKKHTFSSCWQDIKAASLAVVEIYYKKGGTVFLIGNGGSAADAQHIAGELFSIFHLHRIPLSANALTTDTSVLTSISNDLGYEYIFSRQLEALATPKDLVIGLSASGNSMNVINGIKLAKSRGIKTVVLTGKNGGELAKIADIVIKVPSDDVARIQEVHTTVGHIICGIVEETLFGGKGFNG
ncbi:MAG TPA: SIS domain-containing protein [Patescibacteria group bacterium]|nr:SIS domain-containing protein [Patescibacteria group bacterium]